MIDVDKIRLGMENRRLVSLLCAVMAHTGPVTLTKEEAEREWEGRTTLHRKENPDGSLTIWIDP